MLRHTTTSGEAKLYDPYHLEIYVAPSDASFPIHQKVLDHILHLQNQTSSTPLLDIERTNNPQYRRL